MSGDSTATAPRSSRRPHSPDVSSEGDIKRRRKVRSCYDCRRRKLHCDQAAPACGRCVKGGVTCVYLDDPSETLAQGSVPIPEHRIEDNLGGVGDEAAPSVQNSATFVTLLRRLDEQEKRTQELQAQLAFFSQQRSGAASYDDHAGKSGVHTTNQATALLKGQSFKTRFFGVSHPEALMTQIRGLAALSKGIVEQFPILVKVRQDFRAMDHRTGDESQAKHTTPTRTGLEALLPPRLDTDELVQLYLDSYDNIYHIVHIPTFWQEYNGLWSDVHHARPHFIALVLLMTSLTSCLRRKEPWLYRGKNSSSRDKALDVVQTCEEWMKTQGQKKVTVTDFQIQFLINLTKCVLGTKMKRSWIEAGTALRLGMSAGLHRHMGSRAKPTSELDMEMRRRIWFALAEFELQAAFARGMDSHVWPTECDCGPPRNVLDSDLSHDTAGLPCAKSMDQYTKSSYMSVAYTSFTLRTGLNSSLNNTQNPLPRDETYDSIEQIERHIQEIPSWPERSVEATLLKVQLLQYLLLLHHRRWQESVLDSERNYSRLALVETAAAISEAHRRLVERGSHVLALLCNDHLRAALAVCQAINTPDQQTSSTITRSLDYYAEQVTRDVLHVVESKVDRLGAGQQEFWIALVANALVKIEKAPEQRQRYIAEVVSRMTGSYYKIMACQEVVDPPGPADASRPSSRMAQPGDIGFRALDADAIPAWMLEGWVLGFDDDAV